MNRSFRNVLFGAFGKVDEEDQAMVAAGGERVQEASVGDAAMLLSGAGSVIVCPGYGMAVAQAQHVVGELADILEANGTQVRYAIHPVAGRMPGHMNVLLAEAKIPYTSLMELEEINEDFKNTDVALVVGANDVVTPRRQAQPGELDLRHAGAQRRPRPLLHRAETLHAPRLRRHRERTVLRAEHGADVRGREGHVDEGG